MRFSYFVPLTLAFLLIPQPNLAQSAGSITATYFRYAGAPLLTPSITPKGGGPPEARNVILVQPAKDSPFAKQGLKHLDMIHDVVGPDGSTRLSDLGPFQAPHLVRLLAGLPKGTELTIEYTRQANPPKRGTLRFRVPEPSPDDVPTIVQAYRDWYLIAGALLAPTPPEVAHFLKTPMAGMGLLLIGAYDDGALPKAGARRGDILWSAAPAGGAAPCPFPNLEVFYRCLDAHGAEGPMRFTLLRGSEWHTVTAPLPPNFLSDVHQRVETLAARRAAAIAAEPAGIESLTLAPDPARCGEPFEVTVRFRSPHAAPVQANSTSHADPASPATLHLRILAGSAILLAEKPVSIPAAGSLLEHVFRLKAASQPGSFVVEATLEASSQKFSKSATLRVE